MHWSRRAGLVLCCLLVPFLLGLACPVQAEYTKLYRFTNNTGTPVGGVRAVNNALEVIESYCVVPLAWRNPPGSPKIGTLLLSGTYCTKLRWSGDSAMPGDIVKVGWTTADNSCRLRDLRWIDTDGVLGDPVLGANQREGAPGGGRVTYDADAGGYIWTITNDTDLPINLSDCELSVLEERPTLDELMQALWPGDLLMNQQGDLPHPDLVAMRVDAIIEDQLQPLIAAVQAERGQPYLPAHDADDLEDALGSAMWDLREGARSYDPADPSMAELHWGRAVSELGIFRSLVSQYASRVDTDPTAAYRLGPYLSRPAHTVSGTLSLNDAGVIASADYLPWIDGWNDWAGYVWDTTQWSPSDPTAGFQSLYQGGPERDFVGDIDAEGRVAGAIMRPANPKWEPCAWEPGPVTGVYTFRDLTEPGWGSAYVYGMNDLGQAVGAGYHNGGWYAMVLDLTTGMRSLNSWPSAFGGDINNLGQIVMYHTYAVVDSNGAIVTPLQDPGWQDFRLVGINDNGQTCGFKYDSPTQAAAWDENGRFIDLHSPGWSLSWTYDINNHGEVSGWAVEGGTTRAKVWDINASPPTCVDAHVPGASSTSGESINNKGEVAVDLYSYSGGWCVALMVPDPPPLPGALANEWLAAAAAVSTATGDLPGPPAQPAEELPPPPVPPPPPPSPAGEPEYTYVSWDQVQQQPQPTLPPDSYSAFVVPDEDGTPDETPMLITRYPVVASAGMMRTAQAGGPYAIESVELYMPPEMPPGMPPPPPPPADVAAPLFAQASITPQALWPPDHRMQEMSLDVNVTDDSPGASWYIESVSSDQPINGTDDGDTAPDWLLDAENDPQALRLRAERAGDRPEGRTYTVVLRAIDASGNLSAPTSLEVHVPLNREATTVITSLSAAPTKGGKVQVAVALSSAAQVEADVLNIAGRRIKAIVRNRQCEAGTATLLWNCQSDRGLAVPSGTYLIRVTAHSPKGQQTCRLCTVTVRR